MLYRDRGGGLDTQPMSRNKRLKPIQKDFWSQRGITLMELLIATVIGLFVLLAFGGIDISRIFLTHEANAHAGFQTNAAYAVGHISRELMDVDRISLLSSTNMQMRRVVGTSLDVAASYDWTQYRYDAGAGEILLYQQIEGGCSAYLLAANIVAVEFAFSDESVVPPGGEPVFGNDNNMLRVTVTSEDPTTNVRLTFRSTVAIRNGAYTGVGTGLTSVLIWPGACT